MTVPKTGFLLRDSVTRSTEISHWYARKQTFIDSMSESKTFTHDSGKWFPSNGNIQGHDIRPSTFYTNAMQFQNRLISALL